MARTKGVTPEQIIKALEERWNERCLDRAAGMLAIYRSEDEWGDDFGAHLNRRYPEFDLIQCKMLALSWLELMTVKIERPDDGKHS